MQTKKLRLLFSVISLVCLCGASTATAATPIKKFSAPDFSGDYTCTGNDANEGAYQASVHLELKPKHSQGQFGAYRFTLEVPGFGTYPGHAASKGKMMAIYFANTDPTTKDYGTGIAEFKKNRHGKWSFSKYYFEPEYKGGNFGFESCTQN
ncbi:hypothetical protein RF679_05960 [Undibacterium cyanobacteriorum]|uniref:Uncharacterized protein n=1 Tax=Undibacterium cyanobacteriorum TaxID=3073561 RepID=A0ABY9RMB1_9BURK|nr:hypothetical protein [Undibacterium sp. 20NA77.5]WMW81825.1 hypothetical protein RF679_05960 [Undibacterium sp. 20NA77.5]